jgi:hypothetical protein
MGYEQELLAEGLCPEIVMVDTEDGPVTGRCQGPVVEVTVPPDRRYGETEATVQAFACEGHSAEWLNWRAMTEGERADWERRRDLEGI